jgi:hypothetical protein
MTDSEHRHQRRFALIPAGVLIGVGVGLIAGYPGAGAMIGLGLGFLGSAFGKPVPPEQTGAGAAGAPESGKMNWFWVILGLFFILIGASLVVTSINIWPYLGAGFLIILGLWFVAKEFRWGS